MTQTSGADSNASQTGGPPHVGPELGAVGRLINVFMAPSKTFESIARRPGWDWIVPVLLLCAAVFVNQGVIVPKMDVDEAVAAQMKIVDKMNKDMPAQQRAEIEEQTRQSIEGQMKPSGRLFFYPILIAVMFFVPALYHAIAAAFGRNTSYMRLVAGYAYTQSIQLIPILLSAVVAYPQAQLNASDVQYNRVLKSNVGAMLDFDGTHKSLLGLLSSVDVFDIWIYVVGTIAVSRLTKFSTKGAALVVGGVWGAYILMKIVLGFVMQAFSG